MFRTLVPAADWAFSNWDTPLDELDNLEQEKPPLLSNEVDADNDEADNLTEMTSRASRIKETIESLQREGEELMREIKDPKKEFVEAMVAKIEATPAISNKSSKPIKMKRKKERNLLLETNGDAESNNAPYRLHTA